MSECLYKLITPYRYINIQLLKAQDVRQSVCLESGDCNWNPDNITFNLWSGACDFASWSLGALGERWDYIKVTT